MKTQPWFFPTETIPICSQFLQKKKEKRQKHSIDKEIEKQIKANPYMKHQYNMYTMVEWMRDNLSYN
jgi:hypothetical protein